MVSMRETETTWGLFLLYGTKSAGEEGLRPADKGIDMQKVLRRKQQEDSCESQIPRIHIEEYSQGAFNPFMPPLGV